MGRRLGPDARNGTEELSQAATASLNFQHPQSIPAAIVPTEHDEPSCSVPDLGVATDALRNTTSSATFFYSLERNKQQDSVAPSVGSDISGIPLIVDLIPRSSTSTIVVSDSPSSPIELPLP